MNRPEPRPVPRCHILVEALHRSRTRKFTELLVHVVGTATAVITNPDTKVLDSKRALLVDGVDGYDLAVGLLHLLQLGKEVPETRLCDDLIECKDAHAVELGGGLSLRGQMAPDDLEFLQTHLMRQECYPSAICPIHLMQREKSNQKFDNSRETRRQQVTQHRY